jgi:hypothetical protein
VAWGKVLVQRDEAGEVSGFAVEGGDFDSVFLLLDA